jgi:hypothetical protein
MHSCPLGADQYGTSPTASVHGLAVRDGDGENVTCTDLYQWRGRVFYFVFVNLTFRPFLRSISRIHCQVSSVSLSLATVIPSVDCCHSRRSRPLFAVPHIALNRSKASKMGAQFSEKDLNAAMAKCAAAAGISVSKFEDTFAVVSTRAWKVQIAESAGGRQ